MEGSNEEKQQATATASQGTEVKASPPASGGSGSGSSNDQQAKFQKPQGEGAALLLPTAKNYVATATGSSFHTVEELDDVIEDTLANLDTIYDYVLAAGRNVQSLCQGVANEMSENVSKMEELYAAVDRVEGFVERVASHVKSAGQRVNDLEAAFIKTPGGKAWKQTQGQSEDEDAPFDLPEETPAAIAALRPELMLSNAADSTQ